MDGRARPKGLGASTGGFGRDLRAPAALRICTGDFINGKEKPLHLFVECRESVGGFQAWPIAGRCALLGNAMSVRRPVKCGSMALSEDRNK